MPRSGRDPILGLGEWDATGRGGGARLPTPLGPSSLVILDMVRGCGLGDVDRGFSISSKARTENGVIDRGKRSGVMILSGIDVVSEGAGTVIEPLRFDEWL